MKQTPLEKALERASKIDYCDECKNFTIVGDAAYCKADGKLIHPLMVERGQGYGPARNCKNAEKAEHDG